jgi:hypothetical protein
MEMSILTKISMAVAFLAIIFFAYPAIRYEETTVGRADIRHDRLTGTVYVRNIAQPDAPWRATKFKNLKIARAVIEINERRNALIDAQEATQNRIEELQEDLYYMEDRLRTYQEEQQKASPY